MRKPGTSPFATSRSGPSLVGLLAPLLGAAVLLGTAVVLVAPWTHAEVTPGHSVATEPRSLPGRVAASTGTFVLIGSDLPPAKLQARLGKGARVKPIAAGLEVSGVAAGHLAVVAHALARTPMQLTEKGKQVRPRALEATELELLAALNVALLRFALVHDFGAAPKPGPGPLVARALYPAPECWKMNCSDCGAAPGGRDCAELEHAKDDTYDAYVQAATAQELWRAARQATKRMQFHGGVAGLIGDLVSAASTTQTSGTASERARAQAELLIEMARDGALEHALRELAVADLSELDASEVDRRFASAEATRTARARALEQARARWTTCMYTPVGETASELTTHKRAVTRYDGCRYRLHMGEPPECKLERTACP